MNDKYKFGSSWVATFAFTTFVPFAVVVLFLQLFNNLFISLISFAGWLMLLLWINNVKIYEDRIVVSRFFWSKIYKIGELKSVSQTHFFSPKLCFIVFKKGVDIRKFIAFIPVPEIFDLFLNKNEDSIQFLKEKIAKQIASDNPASQAT